MPIIDWQLLLLLLLLLLHVLLLTGKLCLKQAATAFIIVERYHRCEFLYLLLWDTCCKPLQHNAAPVPAKKISMIRLFRQCHGKSCRPTITSSMSCTHYTAVTTCVSSFSRLH
jgi:hypothetical protein